MNENIDEKYMRMAIELAKKGAGFTLHWNLARIMEKRRLVQKKL